jgi:hypothetical protein
VRECTRINRFITFLYVAGPVNLVLLNPIAFVIMAYSKSRESGEAFTCSVRCDLLRGGTLSRSLLVPSPRLPPRPAPTPNKRGRDPLRCCRHYAPSPGSSHCCTTFIAGSCTALLKLPLLRRMDDTCKRPHCCCCPTTTDRYRTTNNNDDDGDNQYHHHHDHDDSRLRPC